MFRQMSWGFRGRFGHGAAGSGVPDDGKSVSTRRTPPAPAAATRVAPDPVAEPPRWRPPAYPAPPSAAPVPQSVAARQVAVVPELQDAFWRVVGGAIKVIYYLVIAYVALFIFALVGYFLTTVLPWFLKVVVPIAWP